MRSAYSAGFLTAIGTNMRLSKPDMIIASSGGLFYRRATCFGTAHLVRIFTDETLYFLASFATDHGHRLFD
jgi:hypothetical protein